MAEEATEKATPGGRGKRSRREVLAGAAGALGVLAAQTLGKATPAQAGSDGDVVLGVDGQSTGGDTGVITTSLFGLHGESTDAGGTGVYGQGGFYGVQGEGHTGVYGSGIYGVAGIGYTGVSGVGENGNGVFGLTALDTTSGVYGQNDRTGYGVTGRSNNGTGVLADSANGTALKVTGKVQFSRSRVATVTGTASTPKKSVRVTLPITAESMMTATLQKYVPGVFVVAAVPNVSGGYFTIYLNKSVTTSVGPIAWIIVERP
jgi:hypothetical protein